MHLLNSFSGNMLANFPSGVSFEKVPPLFVASMISRGDLVSAVGHADTAAVFADDLGVAVVMNRATVSLKTGDWAVVGQYRGPRLPEGATTLPDGAEIVWLLVKVLDANNVWLGTEAAKQAITSAALAVQGILEVGDNYRQDKGAYKDADGQWVY
jgi:hypothetical protein